MNMNVVALCKSRTSPAAETSDPPASAFLERRPLKQEGSLSHPVNGYLSRPTFGQMQLVANPNRNRLVFRRLIHTYKPLLG
jgi:hypothetical protein